MALTSARLSGNRRLLAAFENRPEIVKAEKDRKAVEILQTCFVELGFEMPLSTRPSGLLDGEFGQETEAVVKMFQRANGLKADGFVGRNTLTRLDAIFAGLEQAEGPSIRVALNAPQGWAIS